jgi:hypothetical protein
MSHLTCVCAPAIISSAHPCGAPAWGARRQALLPIDGPQAHAVQDLHVIQWRCRPARPRCQSVERANPTAAAVPCSRAAMPAQCTAGVASRLPSQPPEVVEMNGESCRTCVCVNSLVRAAAVASRPAKAEGSGFFCRVGVSYFICINVRHSRPRLPPVTASNDGGRCVDCSVRVRCPLAPRTARCTDPLLHLCRRRLARTQVIPNRATQRRLPECQRRRPGGTSAPRHVARRAATWCAPAGSASITSLLTLARWRRGAARP